MDEQRLHQFIGKIIGDLGGAASVPLVRMGDALGLYRMLSEKGPMTSEALAREAKVHERYLREWLSFNAASGYLIYNEKDRSFTLPAEHAMIFVNEESPVYMMGAFDLMVAQQENQSKVQQAFRDGGGVAWGAQAGCMFCAVARFFRPGYYNNLVAQWLPALDGVAAKLEQGCDVADVGCGHGWSTVLMAQAFPKSRFVGFDFHDGSIEEARKHADAHGVAANTRFEVATAKEIPGGAFDLVTCFDCLHDMGDPAGVAAHIRRSIKPDGTWMVVEPMAGDRLEDNLNPVSRLYYAASTMVCVPTSLAQEVGAAFGAQAGEAKLRHAISDGGFGNIRRAAENPFTMVLEARA